MDSDRIVSFLKYTPSSETHRLSIGFWQTDMRVPCRYSKFASCGAAAKISSLDEKLDEKLDFCQALVLHYTVRFRIGLGEMHE